MKIKKMEKIDNCRCKKPKTIENTDSWRFIDIMWFGWHVLFH